MIIYLTTAGHDYTVKEPGKPGYASNIPATSAMDYHHAFWARQLPRATYIFTDLERLQDWECRCAADLYRKLRDQGLRCLNDPARAMTRFELLRSLHRAGFNPFTVYRADDDPHPARFPVFIRLQEGHAPPLSALLEDQQALEEQLIALAAAGWPRRLLLVLEFCAEPIAEGIWRKHGTMRIGNEIYLDRNVFETSWVVKGGTKGIWTEAMFQDESDAIATRRYAEMLRPAFDIAGIEYGRADHGTVGEAEILYEINTNPLVTRGNKQESKLRDAALAKSAQFYADALSLIDTAATGAINLDPSQFLPRRGPWPARAIIRI